VRALRTETIEANEHITKLGTTMAGGNHQGAYIQGISDFA
jgi:hypothetical protein